MNKASVIEVKREALEAIKHLLAALEAAGPGYEAGELAALHRAVGILVGETQVRILDPVYSRYPELSDLGA